MIRITERTRIDAVTRAQSRAQSRLDQATRIASSGQRVIKPSDDPVAYGAAVRSAHALGLIEEHARTAARAQGGLEVAHDALAHASDLLSQAKALAVSGANGTLDGPARQLIAGEVRMLRDELASVANVRYDGRYLFGGTRTDVMPFESTTGAFVGNGEVVRVPLLDGMSSAANVSGELAFTAAGGRDVFADLDALASALEANDADAIRAAIDPIEAGRAQVVRAQVEAGFGAERFRSALDVLATTKLIVTERLSSEIGGDPIEQLTELTLASAAYEQSLGVTKQLLAITTASR